MTRTDAMLAELKSFTRPLRRQISMLLGRELRLRPTMAVPTEVHGTEYGGFAVLKGSLEASSLIWSCGVGEDASFDLSLIATYGCTVHAFDPTPKAVAWVRRTIQDPRFRLHECAISDRDGPMRLYLPRNENWVSASAVFGRHTRGEHVEVPGRRLASIRRELGTPDLLKMDIEGAEYAVLRDLLEGPDRFYPRQLALEFHHFFAAFGVGATRDAIARLTAAGYGIAWVSPTRHEVLFVRLR